MIDLNISFRLISGPFDVTLLNKKITKLEDWNSRKHWRIKKAESFIDKWWPFYFADAIDRNEIKFD